MKLKKVIKKYTNFLETRRETPYIRGELTIADDQTFKHIRSETSPKELVKYFKSINYKNKPIKDFKVVAVKVIETTTYKIRLRIIVEITKKKDPVVMEYLIYLWG